MSHENTLPSTTTQTRRSDVATSSSKAVTADIPGHSGACSQDSLHPGGGEEHTKCIRNPYVGVTQKIPVSTGVEGGILLLCGNTARVIFRHVTLQTDRRLLAKEEKVRGRQ
jgi:hypothetical protein